MCKLKCTRVVDRDVRPLPNAESCQRLNFLNMLVKDSLYHVDTVIQDTQYTSSMSRTVIDDNILTEYADPYHLEINPTVQPVIHPPHKGPLRLKLERLVEESILAPASEATDWVSSMVTVVKPRICIDPKDLNSHQVASLPSIYC